MDDTENGAGEIDLNVVGRSELLSHPTASRARAPKRRPPSGINFKEVSSFSKALYSREIFRKICTNGSYSTG